MNILFSTDLSQPEAIHPLNCRNWPEFSGDDVTVMFGGKLTPTSFMINFVVKEPLILSRHREINTPVYQDSCVELFISFDQQNYYNLEFNPAGAVLGQFGSDRHNRRFIKNELLKQIKTTATLPLSCFGLLDQPKNWGLIIEIPWAVFYDTLPNPYHLKKIYMNCYKCGDQLPEKHYLSLFPIHTKKPDFHKPEFFQLVDIITYGGVLF